MRIAVLSTLASGGAATGAWRVTRALADYGHECSFFVLESSGNPLQIPLLSTDEAFWLPALFRHWSSLTKPEALTAHSVELFSDTQTALGISFPLPEAIHNADVVLMRWVAGMLFSPFLLLALAGKKVVWALPDSNAFTGGCHYTGMCCSFQSQCRDCPLLKRSGSDDASARCFYLKKRLYPLLQPSIVTPSAWLAEEVKTSALLGNYPVTTIPHPLDMEIFRPPQSRLELREKLGLSEDAFVILSGCEFLGNPRKNTKVLFEALSSLAEQSPALPVVVALYGYGQAPELAFPVRHFGYMTDKVAMAELYGAADIFVHTAQQEAFGLTLCEAQACGTPTLCFPVGGCPETMLPGKTGFLVTEITSQALVEKLHAAIVNRGGLDGMREAARAFAEKRFNPTAVATAYTEVFEKAQAAPGLKTSDPLFVELLQNQIDSLASIFQEDSKYFDSRIGGVEARLPHLDSRMESFEMRLIEQAKQLETLRWKLRHPFRWFLQKLFSKFRKKDV